MKFHASHLPLLLGLLAAGLFAWPAAAQTPPPPSDDAVNGVARELYCPVCENTPLDVCPTRACAEWRELIRQKLSDGWGKDQIKQYFADQYGDRVLAEPPRHGLNWLVYILPPLVLLAGALALFFILRGMRSRAASSPPPSPDVKYLAQVEEELKHRKNGI